LIHFYSAFAALRDLGCPCSTPALIFVLIQEDFLSAYDHHLLIHDIIIFRRHLLAA